MIRLLGDVHGDIDCVIHAIEMSDHPVVQVGDLGFRKNYEELAKYLKGKSGKEFYCIPGNHDDYDAIPDYGWFLPNGTHIINGVKFFSIRGAHSIDQNYRKMQEAAFGYKSWWSQEEMDEAEMEKTKAMYEKYNGDIVIAHTLPREAALKLGNGNILERFGYHRRWSSRTSHFISSLLETHKPSRYYCGHFHFNKKRKIGGITYQVLDINQDMTIS